MKVYIFEDKESLYERLSQSFINEVINNPKINLGLATGSSVEELYKKLIIDHKENGTSYSRVKTFNLDEYVGLEPSHLQSYQYFMYDHLFDHIDISQENINIPLGNVNDLDAECKRYNAILNSNHVDVQLLGIGNNGHIAFNEPGTAFDTQTIVVKLTDETIVSNGRFFDSIEEVPTTAITMGIASIMKAEKIILVATGLIKAQAIKDSLEGLISKNVPGSVLQTHKNIEVYLDKEAASLLTKY